MYDSHRIWFTVYIFAKNISIEQSLLCDIYWLHYRDQKLVTVPSSTCGEIETVVHFICDCEEYEEERQKLLTQMFYLTGAQVISAEIFLSLKEEIFKEHRESLLMLLSEYITSTKRFLKK